MKPALLVIAGPNGSGKTTLTARLRQDTWSEGVEYLNPDEVAQDRFGDWNSPDAVLQAAQWTTARREELLFARRGLAFETVFSAPDKLAFLVRARHAGYFSRIFFVGTSDPRINAARVAGRVMQGGHSVPIEKIITRYSRSMANLRVAFRLADRIYIYDNSPEHEEAKLGTRIENGQLRKVYGPLPDWIAEATAGLPRHPDFIDLSSS
ncbi:MAG TPA: zeta toxin family protein [Polyangiaceae bacterium]